MAKSFIAVVQDSPRRSQGIPVKTKNPLLSHHINASETAFRL